MSTSLPKVIQVSELSASEAKWITLQKIKYKDADGNERLWESAQRKTRKSSGIDAVAVLAIIRSKTGAFPVSTVIIEQYRPPIDKFIVELPAGLVDDKETAEEAAVRELHEETGYQSTSILETSAIMVPDPGMTNANMKLVTVEVLLDDELQSPDQKLDAGEFIIKRVVALSDLHAELGAYDKKGFVVDAKLAHLAFGFEMAGKLQKGFTNERGKVHV